MSLPVAPSPEQLLQKVVDIVLDFFKEQLVTLKEGEVVSYASNIDFLLSKASNKDDIVGPYNGQEIIYMGRLVNQDEYEIICEVKNSSDLVLKPNEEDERQNTQLKKKNENETGSVKLPLFKLNELDNLIIELNKYTIQTIIEQGKRIGHLLTDKIIPSQDSLEKEDHILMADLGTCVSKSTSLNDINYDDENNNDKVCSFEFGIPLIFT